MAEKDNNALVRRAMSVLGRRSAAKLTAEELTERGRKAAQSLWANIAPEERSVEMKRRAKVRERNKAKVRKTDMPSSR